MYKLIKLGNSYTINTESKCIPVSLSNSDYQQFIQDVAEQGIEIVEGPDIIEPDYATLRQQEYPSREEQLDMMYWDRVKEPTSGKRPSKQSKTSIQKPSQVELQ